MSAHDVFFVQSRLHDAEDNTGPVLVSTTVRRFYAGDNSVSFSHDAAWPVWRFDLHFSIAAWNSPMSNGLVRNSNAPSLRARALSSTMVSTITGIVHNWGSSLRIFRVCQPSIPSIWMSRVMASGSLCLASMIPFTALSHWIAFRPCFDIRRASNSLPSRSSSITTTESVAESTTQLPEETASVDG